MRSCLGWAGEPQRLPKINTRQPNCLNEQTATNHGPTPPDSLEVVPFPPNASRVVRGRNEDCGQAQKCQAAKDQLPRSTQGHHNLLGVARDQQDIRFEEKVLGERARQQTASGKTELWEGKVLTLGVASCWTRVAQLAVT